METKLVAKGKNSNINEPTNIVTHTSEERDNAINSQGTKVALDENEFPALAATIRKDGGKGKRVAEGGLEEQTQASCSTNHIVIANKFEVLTQGCISSVVGQGEPDHPILL